MIKQETRELILNLRQQKVGFTSIAKTLNARELKTSRGNKWTYAAVYQYLNSRGAIAPAKRTVIAKVGRPPVTKTERLAELVMASKLTTAKKLELIYALKS